MTYFGQVTFTTNVMRKKVCVDISLFSVIFIGNMFGNNMTYFGQVTFTTNVMRKKVCVDISLFSVISYRACAIASEVIKIGQI